MEQAEESPPVQKVHLSAGLTFAIKRIDFGATEYRRPNTRLFKELSLEKSRAQQKCTLRAKETYNQWNLKCSESECPWTAR